MDPNVVKLSFCRKRKGNKKFPKALNLHKVSMCLEQQWKQEGHLIDWDGVKVRYNIANMEPYWPEQAWLKNDLLYDQGKIFCCRRKWVIASGQDRPISPTGQANQNKGLASSCRLMGASHKQNFIHTLIFILLRFFKVLLFYDPQHPNTLNDRTLLIFTGL